MGSVKSALSESCFEPSAHDRRANLKAKTSTAPLLGEGNATTHVTSDASDDEKHKEPGRTESLHSLCNEVQSARNELQEIQAQFARIGGDGNATEQIAALAKQLQQSSERYNELVSSMLTAATAMDANNKSLTQTVGLLSAENELLKSQADSKGNVQSMDNMADTRKVHFSEAQDNSQHATNASTVRLQSLIEQSASLRATELKQLVMKKYSTIAYIETDDEDNSIVADDHDSDSAMDDEELEEIQRMKLKQSLEVQEQEEMDAMRRAMASDVESDGDDLPSGAINEETAKDLNMEQLKRHKREMQEHMAHLVQTQSMHLGASIPTPDVSMAANFDTALSMDSSRYSGRVAAPRKGSLTDLELSSSASSIGMGAGRDD